MKNNYVTLFEILWKEVVERFKETSQLMKNVRLGSEQNIYLKALLVDYLHSYLFVLFNNEWSML